MPSDPERGKRIKRGQRFADEGDEAADAVAHETKAYTPRQGQYLAFIYYYTKIHGRAPAEADRSCRISTRITPSGNQDGRVLRHLDRAMRRRARHS